MHMHVFLANLNTNTTHVTSVLGKVLVWICRALGLISSTPENKANKTQLFLRPCCVSGVVRTENQIACALSELTF